MTYFVTSITMPDLQSSDESHRANDVSVPSAFTQLQKNIIVCRNRTIYLGLLWL